MEGQRTGQNVLEEGGRDLAIVTEHFQHKQATLSAMGLGGKASNIQRLGKKVVNVHKSLGPARNTETTTEKGWIYQILFPNGKSYVGQTKGLKRRMREHELHRKSNDGHLMKRAVRKHGWSNVKINILERPPIDRQALDESEVKWISAIGSLAPRGYNLTSGGDAQPMDNPITAAWQKKRIGEAMRRPSVRAKKRALWKDTNHRKMMYDARTGSDVFIQTRKDCQNTDEINEKRRSTWSNKRAQKLATMSVEEGRAFMMKARHYALRNASRASERIPLEYGRDPVAETMAFWDKEIEGYENGIWLTSTRSLPSTSSRNESNCVYEQIAYFSDEDSDLYKVKGKEKWKWVERV